MLFIKSSLIAFATSALLVRAASTDIAYETEGGQVAYFHVSDEDLPDSPEATNIPAVAHKTETDQMDRDRVLDQTDDIAVAKSHPQ